MKITQLAKLLCSGLLIGLLSIGLVSCGGEETPQAEEVEEAPAPKAALTEVAPPAVFEELRQTIDNYQPQVSILRPQNGEVIEDTRVSIEVDVKDYPLFKNEELGMGPHLHVILDNQPYRAVYTAEEPIVFEDLTPGTHTIRMFASRPWHESFKNEGAYAQVTFHLFTETAENAPDSEQPLLTYSRPKGTYGAEPILLDYYLTNAPIRLDDEDSSAINPASQRNWRVRATINGESFIMDSWLPVYLEGFEVGQNWIKLELLDGDGNLINNDFNTAARLFSYQPQGEDTLSKLVRGELTAEEARVIVDAEYEVPQPEAEEEITPEEGTAEETPEEEIVPEQLETPEEGTAEETPEEEEITPEEGTAEETPEEEEITPEEGTAEETPEEEEITPEEGTAEETPEEEEITPEEGTAEETPEEEIVPEQPETPEEEAVTEDSEMSSQETAVEETPTMTDEPQAEESEDSTATEKTEEAETSPEEQEAVVEEKKEAIAQ
ncbi:hypothetical protein PCC7418_1502 [Halothece sp. PCC 7418]|uniref:DUF6130 family protein n=1 Tax=Halothece sp. (strain PCC 7418) TaxID=65093 RepID=UPI0002A0707D|nr:DUF6130 family protein [Halothece sp. PCC 7418]AFZ43691.1 hypothetical protein PCC7418_1502 [Halothece sp. PCC 7418]